MSFFGKLLKKTGPISKSDVNELQMILLYKKMALIFNHSDIFDPEFYKALKECEYPTSQICGKDLTEKGAFHCEECGNSENSIICSECYERSKKKHENHKITFSSQVGGCCDCGNGDYWSEDGFCEVHKGIFKTKIEINDYISKCFSPERQNKINNLLDELFNLLTPYFLYIEDSNKFSDEKFPRIVDSMIDMFNIFCECNLGILHMICLKMLQNYPFKTRHDCIIIDENFAVQTVEKKGVQHKCKCSFLRILMSVWNSKCADSPIFLKFLHSHPFKTTMGLLYFLLYKQILSHDAIKLINFSSQIISEELALKIASYPEIILNIFNILYDNVKEGIKLKRMEDNKKFIISVYKDFSYLLKPKSAKKLASNLKMFKKCIDVMALYQNYNSFRACQEKQREGWNVANLDVEIFLLKTFSLVSTLIDYDDVNQVKTILGYFIDKIDGIDYTILPPNECSFHMTLFRSFSIFLNRFCFSDSLKNNSDLSSSFANLMKIIPDSTSSINEILIRELLKFLGFVLSTEKLWVNYGETMCQHLRLYYLSDIFYQCDFTLLKYLMSLPENKKYFQVEKILEYTNVKELNSLFLKNVIEKKDLKNCDLGWVDDFFKKFEISQIGNIFTTFLKMLRNNYSMLDLAGYSSNILKKNKFKDEILQKLMAKEGKNYDLLLKEKLVHAILENDNLVEFSEIKRFLGEYFNSVLSEDFIRTETEKIAEKVKTNQQFKFAVKNEILKEMDLDYILNPTLSSKVERYLLEFKKNQVNLLNTFFYPTISLEKSLETKCYLNFFSAGNNFKFIVEMLEQMLTNEKFEVFHLNLLNTFLKFICIYVALNKGAFKSNLNLLSDAAFNDINNYYNNNINKIVSNIENTFIKDEATLSNLKYFKDLITNNDNKEKSKNDEMKTEKNNKKKALLAKMKNKFKKQNEKVEQKFDSEIKEIEKENKDDAEKCVMCRKPINAADYSKNSFGKIGMIVGDFFLDNACTFCLEAEYNKNKGANEKISMNEILKKDFLQKSKTNVRILTCNHKIHTLCYDEFIASQPVNLNNILSLKKDFACPLCKKLGNVLIPCLSVAREKMTQQININELSIFKPENKEADKLTILMPSFHLDEKDLNNDLLNQSLIYFESFILNLDKKEFKLEKNNYLKFIEIFMVCYKEFMRAFFFFEMCEDKVAQIDNWKNLFLSMRILAKCEYLNNDFLVAKLILYLDQLKKCKFVGTDFTRLLDNGIVEDDLVQVLLVLCVLFDESFERHLLNLYLVYYLFTAYQKFLYRKNFLRIDYKMFIEKFNIKDFEAFLKFSPENNKNEYFETKKIIDQFLKRLVHYKFIVNNVLDPEKLNNIDVYLELDIKKYENLSFYDLVFGLEKELDFKTVPEFLRPLKDNYSLIEFCIDEYAKNDYLKKFDLAIIRMKLLNYGVKIEYTFIDLPENMIEFTAKYQNLPCTNCGVCGRISLVCLSCGKKICDSKECVQEALGLRFNSFFLHSNICGGGNCVYISSSPGDIFFVQGMHPIPKNLYGYLNKFKESVKNGQISNDFVLQKNELEMALQMFINYSYRKLINLR